MKIKHFTAELNLPACCSHNKCFSSTLLDIGLLILCVGSHVLRWECPTDYTLGHEWANVSFCRPHWLENK